MATIGLDKLYYAKITEDTGVIRVEGVGSDGEMISVVDIIIDRLRQEVRV